MSEKAELTELGNPVIPVELIGQNIVYKVFGTPPNPAYPTGKEVSYSDDYISRLNNIYSLDDILGERKEDIKKHNGLDQFREGLVRFPWGLTVLGDILINSVQVGLWQPLIIDVSQLNLSLKESEKEYPGIVETDRLIRTAKEYLDLVESRRPTYERGFEYPGGFPLGLLDTKEQGFSLLTQYMNKYVIALPSQKFVEHCAARK